MVAAKQFFKKEKAQPPQAGMTHMSKWSFKYNMGMTHTNGLCKDL